MRNWPFGSCGKLDTENQNTERINNENKRMETRTSLKIEKEKGNTLVMTGMPGRSVYVLYVLKWILVSIAQGHSY
jgi:hypothetical protein